VVNRCWSGYIGVLNNKGDSSRAGALARTRAKFTLAIMIPKQLFGSTRAGTVKRSEMERRPQPHNGTLRETRSAGSLCNGCGESVLTRPLEGDLNSPPETAKQGRSRPSAEFSRNNLDCLRLVLASIVFLFHIYALTNLPAFAGFARYISAPFAVKAFFVISGLLIYRSYTRSSSLASYFEKRIRRIYPAYFAIIVLAAVTLFPLSILPATQYFGLGFWKYLCANLLFLNFLVPSLPGVFGSNDISAVNPALWTLKIEVAFYLFVPVMHYLSVRFGTKRVMAIIFTLSCLWKYSFAFLASIGGPHAIYSLERSRSLYSQMEVQFPAQLAYFVAGIFLLQYFDKLKPHFRRIFCIAACLLLIDHWFTGGVLDVFWISGFVFVLGFWRYFGNFSKYGDFSYGLYIVHCPILQTLIALGIARRNPGIFLIASIALVGMAAFLIWYLVESPFLTRSSHYKQGGAPTRG
jgi:peptidoglycan/LPS O-acetylase OafA/YrhL